MKLKEYLKKEGMSDTQFALKLGVSKPLIGYWKRGKVSPNSQNIYKITMITDGAVTLADFVNLD